MDRDNALPLVPIIAAITRYFVAKKIQNGTKKASKSLTNKNVSKMKNALKPNKNAKGEHTSFKRDEQGNITNYRTYEYNKIYFNKNPKSGGFIKSKGYDGKGKPHNGVDTPHIHDYKSGITRKPTQNEIPKGNTK